MPITRPIKVSPPPLSSPLMTQGGIPTRALTEFLYSLWMRTGGNEDKPESVRGQAEDAQDTADTGVGKANTAQSTAETGISKADTAQNRADSAYDLADLGQVPVGGIMPIAGGFTIPDNWALCDGANGTPDLRDLFPVAAGTTYQAGDTGGSDEATVTTDPGGTGSTAAGTASISTTTAGAATGTDEDAVIDVTANGHTHTVADHTHAVTVATVPPYYALAMIMRTE